MMKSRFFRDTQGLDNAIDVFSPNKLSVCLRLDRRIYERAVGEAVKLGISSGEYVERCLAAMASPKEYLQ